MAQLQHHTHQMEKEIEIELDDLKMSTASESDSAAKTAENPPPVEQAEPLATGRPDMSAFASQVPMHESMVFKLGKGNLERIQKRYFVLYPGVILYYHHRTSYAKDKKNGLVSFIYTKRILVAMCTKGRSTIHCLSKITVVILYIRVRFNISRYLVLNLHLSLCKHL